MRIDIITCQPDLLTSPFQHSIVGRARKKGLVDIRIHDLKALTPLPHQQTDDYQYGGGAGMVMMAEPLALVIDKLQAERSYDEVIYFTPDGEIFNQKEANKTSLFENLILICGHYKGIDQRIRDLYVTKEISVGDFVLTGGEVAAITLVDAVVRLIPGVISDETSALTDSFQDGLLAPPVYTRPLEFKGLVVPEILLSGNHAAIEDWRMEKALEITKTKRPDLFAKHPFGSKN